MIVTKLTKNDKDMLRTEFEKVWHRRDGSVDEKMVKYCIGKTSAYMTIGDRIVTIDKPDIKKDFCFGYHANIYYSDADQADEMADFARTSVEYFVSENLEWTDANGIMSNVSDGCFPFEPWLDTRRYMSQSDDCKFGCIRWEHWDKDEWAESQGWRRLTDDELREYYTLAYEEQLKFIKRLKTYLKRYGMSNVRTWTYWLDE